MVARSYDPPICLKELSLPPGEWLLVSDDNKVVLSANTVEEIVAFAATTNLELESHAFDRFPMPKGEQLIPISFNVLESCPQPQ